MSNRKIWITKDGTKIRIKDMTDSHLLNTIKMLDRKHSRVILDAYCFANMLNGEMAQYQMEGEIDRLEEGDASQWCLLYDDLMEEASRRNITIQ